MMENRLANGLVIYLIVPNYMIRTVTGLTLIFEIVSFSLSEYVTAIWQFCYLTDTFLLLN